MNRFEKKSSLLWLISSLIIIGGASTYPFGTWSRPGPGFLPLLCGIVMAVLSAVVLLQALWESRRIEKKAKGEPFLPARWPKLALALIILLGYGFLLEVGGYLLVTFTFMLLVLKVVEPLQWRTALVEAFLATGVSYMLFEVWLKVPLPQGILPRYFS